jgi:hypothetical protein
MTKPMEEAVSYTLTVIFTLASGKMIERTDKALICKQEAPNTLESGKKINSIIKEKRFGQTALNSKDFTRMVKRMDSGSSCGQMGLVLVENLRIM